ncbi:MAG: serine hydrolase [Anaerolineae bacterium]|nr:serine hydrolase [Anaerolineae bacterium]
MNLEQAVDEAVADIEGVFGVAAHDWATGERLARHGDRPFLTASVVKVPILIGALDRVQHGVFSLDQRFELEPGDSVAGSGLLKEFDPGVSLTLKDYLTAMIVISDNTATNLVLRVVGIPALNDYLASLGLVHTRSHRPVRSDGPLPGEHRGIGTTTPQEMLTLLDGLVGQTLLTPELCDLAVSILKRQQYTEAIPRYLPSGVGVANKVGMVHDVRADVGILFPADRAPITLAVLSDSLTDRRYSVDNPGWIGIARIAKTVYDFWIS